jgi:predicted PurR-regulated permease PerM
MDQAVPVTLRTGLVLLAFAVGLAFAWLAHDILLLGFLGLLIAVVFSFPVGWLSKIMPRGVALLILVVIILGGLAAGVALVAPALAEQVSELRQSAPKALHDARNWIDRHGGEGGAQKASDAVQKASQKALPALLAVVSGLTAAVLVFVLGLFLVAHPETYRDGLRKLVPREQEPVFDESWKRLARELRHWVGGILVSMTLMGTLTAAGLAVAGIHDWFLLGLLTFAGTFVPYVGAVASAIPGILAALAQSPQKALYAMIVYLGIHIVEGYLVQPLVMKRAVEVKPATLLIGQGTMTAIFGIAGTIVATPMLVCLKVLTDYLWVERRLRK